MLRARPELLARLKAKLRRNAKPEHAQKLGEATRYIERNQDRMEYVLMLEEGLPIGSGWIEAGCKSVIKARSGLSGAKWKRKGQQHPLALRSLSWSGKRWQQFWTRCMKVGY